MPIQEENHHSFLIVELDPRLSRIPKIPIMRRHSFAIFSMGK